MKIKWPVIWIGIFLALTVGGVAWSQKLQPSTGIMMVVPTDGIGNACTLGTPCSTTTRAPQTTYFVASTTTISIGTLSQTVFSAGTIINGAWITNPTTATEPLYVNMTGGTATVSEGGSIFAIVPGQTLLIAGGPTNAITITATTTSHAFSAVRF
jgi:hypothetical protein